MPSEGLLLPFRVTPGTSFRGIDFQLGISDRLELSESRDGRISSSSLRRESCELCGVAIFSGELRSGGESDFKRDGPRSFSFRGMPLLDLVDVEPSASTLDCGLLLGLMSFLLFGASWSLNSSAAVWALPLAVFRSSPGAGAGGFGGPLLLDSLRVGRSEWGLS
jgi:hypothetical protein